ncbi:hypothetical protein ACWDV4_01895 [Micromonospora sp. NPDC003197]
MMTGVGVAVADDERGSVTVTRDGTVVDGQEIKGYVHIKADNVTVRDSTIRYDGNHAIRIFDGSVGTVIESTKIYCAAEKTNGIVFGGYTARKVTVHGCRNGFMYSDDSPATITDSTWNGRAVVAGVEPEPLPSSATASAPVKSAAPAASRPSRTATSGDARTKQSGSGTLAIPEGFPGPDNTGVPEGTTLRPSGSLTISKDGQVVSGLNISGCIVVTAKNVVIRKSRITCSSQYSIKTTGAKNLLVEDVEINGMGRNSAAVCCSDYTLRRLNISNVIDGPRLADNTVVEDSWIHHLTRVSGSHNDTLQTTGATNIVVRGNSLESYNPVTKDPLNACLMIGSTTGPLVSNLVFEQNYCNGGNYSIGIRADLQASNIKIRSNVYGRDCRFGIVARPKHPGINWETATNLWADSRKPVVS